MGPYDPYRAGPRPTNGLAIAALVCAFLFAPLGIVFGHLSLSQIRRSGEEGRGIALAGTVLGYVFSAITVLVIAGMVVFATLFSRAGDAAFTKFPGYDSPGMTASPIGPQAGGLPAFRPPPDLGANCTYPRNGAPAGKAATPPRSGRVPTQPAQVSASMTTNQGNVGFELDNGKSPCTVNSFASLAQQGFFDDTGCHRLTTSPRLKVLQCGDPTGTGSGGPGYEFANEYPTNQYKPGDPQLRQPVLYPRGTLAMANAGSGTNGSQFFIVYEDSQLPPGYTVFGGVDQTGLTTVDKIAAVGVAGGGDDGKPAANVRIASVRLD
jgi:peptidyl-prolyl cis-trans isomerase B (cyclophilin B)